MGFVHLCGFKIPARIGAEGQTFRANFLWYNRGMRNALIVLLATIAASAAFGGEVYKSQSAAEKALGLANNVKVGWGSHCIRRGGQVFASFATREYDMAGDVVANSSTQFSSSHSGTVAAVPIGGFAEFCEFTYKGVSRSGVSSVLTGKVVSVEIQISAGASTPSEMVMQRAVENLVKTGVPLPAASGAKPGRVLPVLDSAKRRYGARIAKARYDGMSGKVDIFLFDCRAETADESFMPATPQGMSKEERMKLAKSLKPDTDKGGTTFYSSETEIIPVGSRRIPFNGEPCQIVQ